MADECEIFCCICSYVKSGGAALGETLPCDREPTNERDRYAVAVKKAGMIVGYWSKKISLVSACSLFLLRERGEVIFSVCQRYSSDLVQLFKEG